MSVKKQVQKLTIGCKRNCTQTAFSIQGTSHAFYRRKLETSDPSTAY